MKPTSIAALCLAIFLLTGFASAAPTTSPSTRPFHVLALAKTNDMHAEYVARAKPWLNKLAADNNFTIDYLDNPSTINDDLLSKYQLFIQLNYEPYDWPPAAEQAFIKYIEQGKGGWIGFHHAGLIPPSDGFFDGFPMWPWYQNFLGGIKWKDYNASFASADVHVEDRDHPIMKGVPATFHIEKEEWYTWDTSPRPNVHVIASVDESTYSSLAPTTVPDSQLKKMGGDHPVIWTNTKVAARNVYIFMGHSPILFDNEAYTTIFRNAIFWAAAK